MLIKTIAYILSLLVLISTNGVVIQHHFCGGELVAGAFFAKAKKCEPKVVALTCCERRAAERNLATCGDNKTRKCCEETVTLLKIDKALDFEMPIYEGFALHFVPLLRSFLFLIPFQNFPPSVRYLTYKPPLIFSENPEAVLQVFLC